MGAAIATKPPHQFAESGRLSFESYRC
jgi:hypothetical protein